MSVLAMATWVEFGYRFDTPTGVSTFRMMRMLQYKGEAPKVGLRNPEVTQFTRGRRIEFYKPTLYVHVGHCTVKLHP